MALGLHTELKYYWEVVKVRVWGGTGPDQTHTLLPNCHKRTVTNSLHSVVLMMKLFETCITFRGNTGPIGGPSNYQCLEHGLWRQTWVGILTLTLTFLSGEG